MRPLSVKNWDPLFELFFTFGISPLKLVCLEDLSGMKVEMIARKVLVAFLGVLLLLGQGFTKSGKLGVWN